MEATDGVSMGPVVQREERIVRSVKSRVEKLEAQVHGDSKGAELYNYDGDLITDARIVKMPTTHERGLAIMADGSRLEIAPTANLLDILLTGRKQGEAGSVTSEPVVMYHTCYGSSFGEINYAPPKPNFKDLLYLRGKGNPRPGMMETLVHSLEKRAEERRRSESQ